MNSKLGHVYLYVSDLDKSYEFYKKFLEYLGYKEEVKEDWGFSFTKDGLSIWFEPSQGEHLAKGYHRKRVGLNHLAFHLDSKEDVDKFYQEFLVKQNIGVLYGTPKVFPEYGEKYYAVFLEDPDRIKLEVAYY